MTKIYIASQISHADRWIKLREEWHEHFFTARWPYLIGKVSPDPESAAWFWRNDIKDIGDADAVLVYAEGDDILRGALVEAGIGLAIGKTIYAVGDNVSFGTWQYYPSIIRCGTLAMARHLLNGGKPNATIS